MFMKPKLSWREIPLLIFSILLPQIVGAFGALFTFSSIADWYTSLTRPPLSPPNWVFGPVWTTLYLMMGLSLFLVLRQKTNKSKIAVRIFYIQLFLNFLWSVVFFGFLSTGGGLIVIVAMWIAILMTILKFLKFSRIAAYLLVPYLIWVTFASYLNLAFFWLNR